MPRKDALAGEQRFARGSELMTGHLSARDQEAVAEAPGPECHALAIFFHLLSMSLQIQNQDSLIKNVILIKGLHNCIELLELQ